MMEQLVCTCDDNCDDPCPTHAREYLLEGETAALRARLAEVEAEIERLKLDATMACETPADDCDCAGCLTAAEYYGAGGLVQRTQISHNHGAGVTVQKTHR